MRRFLVLSLLLLSGLAGAQPFPKGHYTAGFTSYYGFVLRHNPNLAIVAPYHPYGAELFVHQRTAGEKNWHQRHQYPNIGFAAGFLDFRSPQMKQVGYVLNYFEKPFTNRTPSTLYLKIGWGLGYATRRYGLDNFQNVALSSRLNYALRGELTWQQRLDPHWQLKTGVLLTHFSNGAFKMPNSGINIPAWQVGVQYHPGPERTIRTVPDTSRHWQKGYSLHLSAAFTLKEVLLPGGRKYPGLVVSGYVNRRINAKSAFNVGLDGTINTAVRYEIARDTTWKSENKPDYKRAALTLGHELFISDRISLLTQLGVYVYQPFSSGAPIYQRYGLKWYWHRNAFAGMLLKAHYGTADFVEWTMGFRTGRVKSRRP